MRWTTWFGCLLSAGGGGNEYISITADKVSGLFASLSYSAEKRFIGICMSILTTFVFYVYQVLYGV